MVSGSQQLVNAMASFTGSNGTPDGFASSLAQNDPLQQTLAASDTHRHT
jgi:hypothetical protein